MPTKAILAGNISQPPLRMDKQSMQHNVLLRLSIYTMLALVFVLSGCWKRQPAPTYYESGYVRSMWHNECAYGLVFETDDGAVFSINTLECSVPPVWVGLHAEVSFQFDDRVESWRGLKYRNIRVIRRLP